MVCNALNCKLHVTSFNVSSNLQHFTVTSGPRSSILKRCAVPSTVPSNMQERGCTLFITPADSQIAIECAEGILSIGDVFGRARGYGMFKCRAAVLAGASNVINSFLHSAQTVSVACVTDGGLRWGQKALLRRATHILSQTLLQPTRCGCRRRRRQTTDP